MGRQDTAPFLDAMLELNSLDTTPFSTPGHKRGTGAPEFARRVFGTALRNDVPHGGGVDTTHMSRGVLREAELLAAEAYGGQDARFLVNGSTSGNLAMLLATCRDGDEVIVSRMLHKSLMAGIIFSGARPVYVTPEIDPELNLPLEVTPAAIERAIQEHPAAKAIVIVSPSYVGIASDLVAIASLCRSVDIPLLVDEAWGPHFHFHPALPASAMASGACASVSSTHKMLSALTQGSTLVVRPQSLDVERLHTIIDMVQTTSPSALIFASLDASRRQMAVEGTQLLSRVLHLTARLRDQLNAVDGVRVLGGDRLAGRPETGFDPTRIIIDVHELGLTGYRAEAILRHEHGVFVEMSDLMSVMLLITIGDDDVSIAQAVKAFGDLGRHRGTRPVPRARSSGSVLFQGVAELTPREAFTANSRAVPVPVSVGHVSAESVTPYPPGIPVVAPGERITAGVVDYLREGIAAGMYISGMSDATLETIRVVA